MSLKSLFIPNTENKDPTTLCGFSENVSSKERANESMVFGNF